MIPVFEGAKVFQDCAVAVFVIHYLRLIKLMHQIFIEKLTVTQLDENSKLLSRLRIVVFSKLPFPSVLFHFNPIRIIAFPFVKR
jgi:hypothetical protein